MGRTCASCCGGCIAPPEIECRVEGTTYYYKIVNAKSAILHTTVALINVLDRTIFTPVMPIDYDTGLPYTLEKYISKYGVTNIDYIIKLPKDSNILEGSFDFEDITFARVYYCTGYFASCPTDNYTYFFWLSAKNDCGSSQCYRTCWFNWHAFLRINNQDECVDPLYSRETYVCKSYTPETFLVTTNESVNVDQRSGQLLPPSIFTSKSIIWNCADSYTYKPTGETDELPWEVIHTRNPYVRIEWGVFIDGHDPASGPIEDALLAFADSITLNDQTIPGATVTEFAYNRYSGGVLRDKGYVTGLYNYIDVLRSELEDFYFLGLFGSACGQDYESPDAYCYNSEGIPYLCYSRNNANILTFNNVQRTSKINYELKFYQDSVEAERDYFNRKDEWNGDYRLLRKDKCKLSGLTGANVKFSNRVLCSTTYGDINEYLQKLPPEILGNYSELFIPNYNSYPYGYYGPIYNLNMVYAYTNNLYTYFGGNLVKIPGIGGFLEASVFSSASLDKASHLFLDLDAQGNVDNTNIGVIDPGDNKNAAISFPVDKTHNAFAYGSPRSRSGANYHFVNKGSVGGLKVIGQTDWFDNDPNLKSQKFEIEYDTVIQTDAYYFNNYPNTYMFEALLLPLKFVEKKKYYKSEASNGTYLKQYTENLFNGIPLIQYNQYGHPSSFPTSFGFGGLAGGAITFSTIYEMPNYKQWEIGALNETYTQYIYWQPPPIHTYNPNTQEYEFVQQPKQTIGEMTLSYE